MTTTAETAPVPPRTLRVQTDRLRTPVAAFRAALLVLCLLLACFADGFNAQAVGRLGVVAGAAVVASWVGGRGRAAVGAALLEALITGAFAASSGGARSPLLPYLLAPGLALGLYGGWRYALVGALPPLTGLLSVRFAINPPDDLGEFLTAGGTWVLLASAIGVVAAGARQVTMDETVREDRYVEARALLQQLRQISSGLATGLDATAAASSLLDECLTVVPATRSAVLTGADGEQLVPLAVRGTRRVPWRAPLSAPGPLQTAWQERRAVVDVRAPDRAGRRGGSCLVAVPLLGAEGPFGLVVLELLAGQGQVPVDVRALQRVVDERVLQIESGLLFEELRSSVTLEERDRLARQMHDGMAQDIAFLGYQLDAVRPRVTALDPALGAELTDVRGRLTALISDIRLSITDLRTTVDSERGLGGALSSYVRAIGAGKDTRVNLSLDESSFRLPGETEVLLFQIAQAVAQDLRRHRGGGQLWVTLSTDPPSAALQVEHDGPMHDLRELGLQEHAETVSKMGGRLVLRQGRSGGPRVEVELGGEDGAGHGAAGR